MTGDCRPSSLLLAQIGIVKSKTSRVRMVFSLFCTWKYYYTITITIIICISIHVVYMCTLSQSDCIIIIINIIYFCGSGDNSYLNCFTVELCPTGLQVGQCFFPWIIFFYYFSPQSIVRMTGDSSVASAYRVIVSGRRVFSLFLLLSLWLCSLIVLILVFYIFICAWTLTTAAIVLGVLLFFPTKYSDLSLNGI